MTVQRLHAGDTYTFAPYNAYFNDYYRLDGDGAAAGQTAQDDTFYYFPRGEAKTLLTARADADPSVLDRLESAYAPRAATWRRPTAQTTAHCKNFAMQRKKNTN